MTQRPAQLALLFVVEIAAACTKEILISNKRKRFAESHKRDHQLCLTLVGDCLNTNQTWNL